MIERNRFFLFIGVLLFFDLIGCAKLEKNYPQRNYYILSITNEHQNSPSISGSILQIPRFKISPSFSGREFVYRKSDLSYESDFYNQFFKSPGSLITDEVRKWFTESGSFKHVVDSSNDVDADYTLQGNVSELYGDFRSSVSPNAVLGVQFLLTDSSASPKIILQNNYRKEIPLEANSPQDLVKGWNEALRQILGELEHDMRKVGLKAQR